MLAAGGVRRRRRGEAEHSSITTDFDSILFLVGLDGDTRGRQWRSGWAFFLFPIGERLVGCIDEALGNAWICYYVAMKQAKDLINATLGRMVFKHSTHVHKRLNWS